MTDASAVQDRYPDAFAVCYGCGRLNSAGHHVRSIPSADGAVAHFTPRPEHLAVPGFVYGGLLASLIDCHGIGTAALAAEQSDGDQAPRFVTASLQVDFLAPTPHGPELQLDARVVERSPRKAIVEVLVSAGGTPTVRGRVVAVRLPPSMAGGA